MLMLSVVLKEYFLNEYLVIMLFKVTPVSIPNTKVKLLEANGTAWETVWESKWLPGLWIFSSVG